MRRREFLALAGLGGLALAAPRRAGALGDAPIGAARLAVADLPNPRPGALADLLKEVAENSSVQHDWGMARSIFSDEACIESIRHRKINLNSSALPHSS